MLHVWPLNKALLKIVLITINACRAIITAPVLVMRGRGGGLMVVIRAALLFYIKLDHNTCPQNDVVI